MIKDIPHPQMKSAKCDLEGPCIHQVGRFEEHQTAFEDWEDSWFRCPHCNHPVRVRGKLTIEKLDENALDEIE